MVADYEGLIEAMPNDQGDRHVAAVAVKCGAQVIVTINMKHFRELPDGLEAQHPDEFLCHLFDLSPESVSAIVHEQAAAMKTPPRSFEDVLRGLSNTVPQFAAMLAAAAS